MARQQGWFALLIALVISAFLLCINLPFQLGLDLRGGSQLTLEVQALNPNEQIKSEQLEAVQSVLDRRVNGLGVAESSLRTIGTNQLILELPGEQEPSKAARVLGKTALLEFRKQKINTKSEMQRLQRIRSQVNNIDLYKKASKDNKSELIENKKIGEQVNDLRVALGLANSSLNEHDQIDQIRQKVNSEIVELFEPSSLTGSDLVSAGRRQEQNLTSWEVTLAFNQDGGEKFASLTKSIAGSDRLLGIILDGESISEASVGEQFKVAGITGGSATISGNFTAESARELEVQLRGGSLPLPVSIVQVRTIGPTLGVDNIRRSLIAALLGLSLVAIFMVSFYRLAGFIAIFALSFYALFNIAIYALIPVTLTLPGVAGFVLSIGMAVDANVLIFERVKDELRRGNTLIRSIETGFSQAFSSIIDGHITTLISCISLFYLGTGFVKGFAATLGIGVFISLFTALSCTRVLLRFFMSYKSLRKTTNFLSENQLPKQLT
ncbi:MULTISPECIES: protein translocase subunit SecD [Prochlorococcus]|uniref:Protein translocase subunit SecD n=1 Tax=Prochlorococcus marinus (strain SARG / CCMP1375 / SS120) TaxID=167539 RepID=SECD_PROMA|nr:MULTISPECIES: protein translocase subunit SecD [Prochlorococcus]Q7VCH3.1 RecName: Full=Protein translocase subunit SecD [Prochlorococcus marinus subsp. marinus str. CCMP1375]AAP99811.1 Preprotein translocase subunit SecD [Prochlorococcus marinus subsp. marinus str. CCMP1375]KGG11843.1 Protein-export membrane protein SecD [Prochlorococcus marinus str. LG]KGG21850.1 Protein-export membrane protein SecD [Prochlorococcus marinus str. SS2]KGG23719.1 Protein-export membrane protein SecD [Prochlor